MKGKNVKRKDKTRQDKVRTNNGKDKVRTNTINNNILPILV